MGAMLSTELVNGLNGDPAVYVYLQQSGEGILFDAGELDRLSTRELLKVRTICISHTHVDHFIGFDRLLRVNIPHFRMIEVIGPAGITKNIIGKLASYTWNLLEPDQINFIVHEVASSGSVQSVKITNSNGFVAEAVVNKKKESVVTNPPTASIPLSHDRYKIDAVVLDHGMDVCAFILRLPDTTAVSKAALETLNLEPGPWIGELQRMASSHGLEGEMEIGPGSTYDARALAEQILIAKAGESVAYVTDIVFSEANLDRMVHTLFRVDTLVCETNYRHEHQARAFAKKHLTTKQAALIAAAISAKNLKIFHVSNIYGEEPEASESEALAFFEQFSSLPAKFLGHSLQEEFRAFVQFSK
jgi:ribonuclease Z